MKREKIQSCLCFFYKVFKLLKTLVNSLVKQYFTEKDETIEIKVLCVRLIFYKHRNRCIINNEQIMQWKSENLYTIYRWRTNTKIYLNTFC